MEDYKKCMVRCGVFGTRDERLVNAEICNFSVVRLYRFLTIVYDTWDCWGSGLRPSSGVSINTKFRELDVFPFSGERISTCIITISFLYFLLLLFSLIIIIFPFNYYYNLFIIIIIIISNILD
jgi:hypothetical protein